MDPEQVPLYEEFIYCCGAATQVLKCGPWKDLLETESKTLPRLLFLIIPGNPGLAGYYRTFIRALYHGLNRRYPVWVVSHAGHCKFFEIKEPCGSCLCSATYPPSPLLRTIFWIVTEKDLKRLSVCPFLYLLSRGHEVSEDTYLAQWTLLSKFQNPHAPGMWSACILPVEYRWGHTS
uniref:Lipid droplet associated hydrolase n=1 Tax=Chrysemys picta bellii TaxID=8478 RepID=A0A8C3PAK8_CHRPI